MVQNRSALTHIQSNGPTWQQHPQTIDQLLEMLEKEPLDPRYEMMGNFISPAEFVNTETPFAKMWLGSIQCLGNFFSCSHVFNLFTRDPALIMKLTLAIRRNQASEEYRVILRALAKSIYEPLIDYQNGPRRVLRSDPILHDLLWSGFIEETGAHSETPKPEYRLTAVGFSKLAQCGLLRKQTVNAPSFGTTGTAHKEVVV